LVPGLAHTITNQEDSHAARTDGPGWRAAHYAACEIMQAPSPRIRPVEARRGIAGGASLLRGSTCIGLIKLLRLHFVTPA
jgi:hypothetical protein